MIASAFLLLFPFAITLVARRFEEGRTATRAPRQRRQAHRPGAQLAGRKKEKPPAEARGSSGTSSPLHHVGDMPPMPPPFPFCSGISVITASVVSTMAAIEAAFWSADRVTLAGSTMPLLNMSTKTSFSAS